MSRRFLAGKTFSRTTQCFAALGGAVAWMAHLILAYLLAEWGCLGGLGEYTWLGITAVAWAVAIVSLLLLGAAIAAALVVQAGARPIGGVAPAVVVENESERFLSRAGQWLNWWFAFVIAVESLPIFWFLRAC